MTDAPSEHSGVFQSLFAAYPDALLVVDTQGSITLANPAAAVLLGYGDGELVGMNIDLLVPDALRARHAARRASYAAHPKARPMGLQTELAARRKDGSEVTVEIALSPLQGERTPLVVAAIRDIGAYPRVKQALRRARYSDHLAQLSRFAVDARDPLAVLGHAPAITAQALEIDAAMVWRAEDDARSCCLVGGVGLRNGEALGSRLALSRDNLPGYVIAGGTPLLITDFRSETRITVAESVLQRGWLSALVVPLLDRGRVVGALLAASSEPQRFGNDEVQFLESQANVLVTSLQRAQTEEVLRHAQRLETVGQLTGGIAHDFNNLLTVILGNLQVLEELPELADQSRARQLVGSAARAGERGAHLTNKLLAFARRQVLVPSAVDVETLLKSLSEMLRRTLDQNIRIDVSAGACPPCLADPVQLESALLNIAINARDAMPGGGRLSFHAEACAAGPADVDPQHREAAAAGSRFVSISVRDSGAGMPDEVKDRAFEPFFTTKEAGRGTGLGLSTVYGFVRQSDGVVTIASELGEGTTVTLYIPQAASVARPKRPVADAADALAQGLRVLLVDDDADVRNVILIFLQTLGCDVSVCADAEQAQLELAADSRFDLLLTDIALGAGMRGTELGVLAQAQRPSLHVLLMSGFSAELLEADRNAPAAWELLRKPCTRAELAQAISRVVKG